MGKNTTKNTQAVPHPNDLNKAQRYTAVRNMEANSSPDAKRARVSISGDTQHAVCPLFARCSVPPHMFPSPHRSCSQSYGSHQQDTHRTESPTLSQVMSPTAIHVRGGAGKVARQTKNVERRLEMTAVTYHTYSSSSEEMPKSPRSRWRQNKTRCGVGLKS